MVCWCSSVIQQTFDFTDVLELKLHIANDNNLFLNWDHPCPGPVLTPNSLEENKNKSIINLGYRGHRWQFLVKWVEFGTEDNKWLGSKMLEDWTLDKWWQWTFKIISKFFMSSKAVSPRFFTTLSALAAFHLVFPSSTLIHFFSNEALLFLGASGKLIFWLKMLDAT